MKTDEELALQFAHILGEHSAAAKALQNLKSRRAGGQNASIKLLQGTWLVGDFSNEPRTKKGDV